MRFSGLYLVLCFVLLPQNILASGYPVPGKELIRDLENIRTENNIATVSLTIINDNYIWSGGLGTLSHKSRIPADRDTIVRVGSITKTFTALSARILEDRELLDLDAPVRNIFPDNNPLFTNQWNKTHPVTIRQLIEHTAGFKDISKAEFDFNDAGNIPLEINLKKFHNTHKTQWPPGMHSSYSNLGAAYTGYAMEQVTGKSYEKIIQDTLLAPLKMKDSGFFLSDSQKSRLAKGYNTDGRTPIPYWNMVYRPFGGLHTTAADMESFLQYLMTLPVEDVTAPHTTLAARNDMTFGYGLGMYSRLRNGHTFYTHMGDADGYLSRYGFIQEKNRAYFVSITAFNNKVLNRMARAIEIWLTHDLPSVRPAPEIMISQKTMKRISGEYTQVATRFGSLRNPEQMSVFIKGNQLYTRKDTRTLPLIPVYETENSIHFRRIPESVATTVIAKGEDGKWYFQDDVGNFVQRFQP